MRISEERGITGLPAAPVGDDETRIPHRPRLHTNRSSSSARMNTSARFPMRLLPRHLSKVAGVVRVLLELNMAHVVIALVVRGLLRVARS